MELRQLLLNIPHDLEQPLNTIEEALNSYARETIYFIYFYFFAFTDAVLLGFLCSI